MKHILLLDDWKRFYQFVKPYRFRALMSILVTLPVGSLDGAIAILMKPFTDEVLLASGTVDIAIYPFLIVAFALVQSSFVYLSNYLGAWVGKKISNDVKLALFDKLTHSDPALFDKSTSGEILLRYSTDADLSSDGLLNNVKTFSTLLVTSVFLVCTLFYFSWVLATVAIGALFIAVIPLSRVKKRIKQYISETVQSGALVTTNYNEGYSGNRVVASYNLHDYAKERLRQTLAYMFRLNIKMTQRTSFLTMAMHFAVAIGMASTVWLQSRLITERHMTFGDFVGFMVALLMFYTPIKKIGTNFSAIQMAFMAMRRVLEALDSQPAISSMPGSVAVRGMTDRIRYEHVNFGYEPGKPVLKDITLDIPMGRSVAFVGNSGGGKTTLANLLPRFYDVDSGSITIDGVDIRDMELASLRDLIAVVFQDNFLFGGTIRENILLGRPGADREEIDAAVRAACLDEFIDSLEHGLDTQIGERGVMLSGGQKQRVAIARAFIKNAPIVILDEATSALDSKSEIVVQQAIENLMANKTVLIIAHRLSTVINSDCIVVIKDGEMVESGRHADLMAMPNGMYASLYKTQLR